MTTMEESERQIDEYLARKSRYVSGKEYEGNGKVLIFNSAKVKPNAQGKFGAVIEYTVREPNSGVERIVPASAVSLITGVRTRLRDKPPGTDVPLSIKRTGTGPETKYVVDHAGN
jgi:hypothetical protein